MKQPLVIDMIEERSKAQSRSQAGQGRREAAVRSAMLGRQLREMYREVAQEPIPPEFLSLLKELDGGGEN